MVVEELLAAPGTVLGTSPAISFICLFFQVVFPLSAELTILVGSGFRTACADGCQNCHFLLSIIGRRGTT